jgi:hypothetical protein
VVLSNWRYFLGPSKSLVQGSVPGTKDTRTVITTRCIPFTQLSIMDRSTMLGAKYESTLQRAPFWEPIL